MNAPELRALFTQDLLQYGPDAPTLCEGWRSRHLAAHLVIREHETWRMLAMVVPSQRPKVERLPIEVGDAALRSYEQLVARFAAGPGKFSLFRLVDEAVNFLEYVVHREDLVRANGAPTEYSPEQRRDIWDRFKSRARRALASKDARVEVVVDDLDGDNQLTLGKDDGHHSTLTVHGNLIDIVMLAHGRPADVDITGPGAVGAAYLAVDRTV